MNAYERTLQTCTRIVAETLKGFPNPTDVSQWLDQNPDWHNLNPRLIQQLQAAWNSTLNEAVLWIRENSHDQQTRATSDHILKQRLTHEGGDDLQKFAADMEAHHAQYANSQEQIAESTAQESGQFIRDYTSNMRTARFAAGWGDNATLAGNLASVIGASNAEYARHNARLAAREQAQQQMRLHQFEEMVSIVQCLQKMPQALADVILNICETRQLNVSALRDCQRRIQEINAPLTDSAMAFLTGLANTIRGRAEKAAAKRAEQQAWNAQNNLKTRRAVGGLFIGLGLLACIVSLFVHDGTMGMLGVFLSFPGWAMIPKRMHFMLRGFTALGICIIQFFGFGLLTVITQKKPVQHHVTLRQRIEQLPQYSTTFTAPNQANPLPQGQQAQAQQALKEATRLMSVVTNQAWRATQTFIREDNWIGAEHCLVNNIKFPEKLLGNDQKSLRTMQTAFAHGWNKLVGLTCTQATNQLHTMERAAAATYQADLPSVVAAVKQKAWSQAQYSIQHQRWTQAKLTIEDRLNNAALSGDLEKKRLALRNNPESGWRAAIQQAQSDLLNQLNQLYKKATAS